MNQYLLSTWAVEGAVEGAPPPRAGDPLTPPCVNEVNRLSEIELLWSFSTPRVR